MRPLHAVAFAIFCLSVSFTFIALRAIFGGPISSGALFFLLPARGPAVAEEIPADYEPLHKGLHLGA